MSVTQVKRSKILDTGSPAKVDANSYYEYKLKIFQGWEDTVLSMGLSGSTILSNDLFLSKGKLKLMTKENFPKNELQAAQQTSRNSIP